MRKSGILSVSMPLGVVVLKSPGVTRWAKWTWRAIAVLPGAHQENWKVLRSENESTEYHAATLPLELFSSDTEAYLHGLSARTPAIYVIMRLRDEGEPSLEVVHVTASPYEAQDFADTGEEIVEKVPMTEGLVAWVRDFIETHHEDEVFIKRRRDKKRVDLFEDGIGDRRIMQMSDVYRAPSRRSEQVH